MKLYELFEVLIDENPKMSIAWESSPLVTMIKGKLKDEIAYWKTLNDKNGYFINADVKHMKVDNYGLIKVIVESPVWEEWK